MVAPGEGPAAADEQGVQPRLTDADVAESAISELGSDNAPSNLEQRRVRRRRLATLLTNEAAERSNEEASKSVQEAAVGDVGDAKPLGGRYISDFPYLLNTQVGLLRFSADPARFIFYGDGVLESGVFEADLGGKTLRLPGLKGLFTFAAANTESPFGPVRGTGFFSGDRTFAFYELIEVLQGNNPAFIFDGVPALVDPEESGFGILTVSLRDDAILDSNVPFLRNGGGGIINSVEVSSLLFARCPLSLASSESVFVQASLGITGQGPNQSSVLALAAGRMLADAGGRAALAGKVRGLGRLGGSSKPVITASNVSSVPQADGESLFGDGKVSNFVLGSDQIDNDSGQRFTALGLQATFEEDPSQTFFTFNHVGTVQ